MSFIVGIDEVGRGPLAGPVSIGVVICRHHFSIQGITDSKLLTEKKRESIVEEAKSLEEKGLIQTGVFSSPATLVDEIGIEEVLSSLIRDGLKKLAPDQKSYEVVLDGRLKAPREYNQQSIVHGDVLVPAISLASIIAKVERDRYMTQVAHESYPSYGFDSNKGYGTSHHLKAIETHGPTPLHRISFLSRFRAELPEVNREGVAS